MILSIFPAGIARLRGKKCKKATEIDPVQRIYLHVAVIFAGATLLLNANILKAQKDIIPEPDKVSYATSQIPDKPHDLYGYPERKRRVGGPTDVEWNLDDSFPKKGSVWELVLKFFERHHKSKP